MILVESDATDVEAFRSAVLTWQHLRIAEML